MNRNTNWNNNGYNNSDNYRSYGGGQGGNKNNNSSSGYRKPPVLDQKNIVLIAIIAALIIMLAVISIMIFKQIKRNNNNGIEEPVPLVTREVTTSAVFTALSTETTTSEMITSAETPVITVTLPNTVTAAVSSASTPPVTAPPAPVPTTTAAPVTTILPKTDPPVTTVQVITEPAKPYAGVYKTYYSVVSQVKPETGWLYDLDQDGIDEMMLLTEKNDGIAYSIYKFNGHDIELSEFGKHDSYGNPKLFIVNGIGGKKYLFYRDDSECYTNHGYYNFRNGDDLNIDIEYIEESRDVNWAEWQFWLTSQNTNNGDIIKLDGGFDLCEKYGEPPVQVHNTLLKLLNEYYFDIDDSSKYTQIDPFSYTELSNNLKKRY